MQTFIKITLIANTKDKAVDILAYLLLKIEKHEFPYPHDNDGGEWVFEWSNLPQEDD